MAITLFPHQKTTVAAAIKDWSNGAQNVLIVLPTGAGKTLVKAEFARQAVLCNEPMVIFAHRDVLLGQISDAMCMMGVHHSFIAAKATVTDITNMHLEEHSRSYYSETSPIILASVDTFIRRIAKGQVDHLARIVKRWAMDEAHHLLADNKWGVCVAALPNAQGLGVTATPLRGDGRGLGRGQPTGKVDGDGKSILDNDGVFDTMIVGATMGQLIEAGRLAPYKIYIPPSRLDVKGVKVTGSGDYNQTELAKRTDNSDITGDAVEHYLRLAAGKQAITFCVNIAHGEHVAAEFNKAGVCSVAISSKTPLGQRNKWLREFKAGRITNLVNCDLFGEGFDVPSVEVVIMLRKTQSYSLFKQQFGRALRVISGKLFGLLIDHVGNVQDMMLKYNLTNPHDDPEWTLSRQKRRRAAPSSEPVGRVCPECAGFYMPQAGNYLCPHCNHTETPEETNTTQKEFQANSGELVELSVDFINVLMKERDKVQEPIDRVKQRMAHAPYKIRVATINNHTKRQLAHNLLHKYIQAWCAGIGVKTGWDIKTVQQQFQLNFKVSILQAQTLSERLALELTEKIKNEAM